MSRPLATPRRIAWASLLWILAFMTLTCKRNVEKAKEPEPCEQQLITFAVIASPRINPTDSGEPRPVQIRLYQLKNDIRLLNASFDEIWKKDADVLKDDLVKVDQFPVYPDSRTEVKFERDESAQYIVAAALFRQPRGRSWFVSFELPPSPADGGCGVPSADCPEGEECPPEPVIDPHFYVWVDGFRIEDGIEHADEYPEGRSREFELPEKPVDSPAEPSEEPGTEQPEEPAGEADEAEKGDSSGGPT